MVLKFIVFFNSYTSLKLVKNSQVNKKYKQGKP